MGYDLHITRAEDWTESETFPIGLEEWLDHVASDPEMRLDNHAEVEIDGHAIRLESEGVAVWTAFSGHGVGGNMAWFSYHSGNVVVKNPDRQNLGKMLQVADHLGASVQGDDGEKYTRVEDLPTDEQDQPARPRPWWRFWSL
jgi:hypothetical protein